jgi:hypothetical protein
MLNITIFVNATALIHKDGYFGSTPFLEDALINFYKEIPLTGTTKVQFKSHRVNVLVEARGNSTSGRLRRKLTLNGQSVLK